MCEMIWQILVINSKCCETLYSKNALKPLLENEFKVSLYDVGNIGGFGGVLLDGILIIRRGRI